MKEIILTMLLVYAVLGFTSQAFGATVEDAEECIQTMVEEDDVSSQWAYEECMERFETNGENTDGIHYGTISEDILST